MTHMIDSRYPCRTAGATGTATSSGRLFLSSPSILKLWYERSRQRRRLARLDERLLRDIGIDRVTAMREASKPFWQA